MAIKQLSVLAANEKGSLKRITGILAENGIDMKSICIADTEDYGILRMITDDNEKAAKLLNEAGITAKAVEIVAAALPNEKGSLDRTLSLFDKNDINLEYMYSIISSHKGEAYMALRVDDNAKTEAILSENGIRILKEDEI